MEFIVRHFYQTDQHEFVSGLPGHKFHFAPTITTSERLMMHIVVPGQGARARQRASVVAD
jgi:hypothetical protein